MYAEKADRRKGGAAGIHPAWRVIGMPACPFCWFVRFLCFFGLFSTNPPKQNTHTHTHTHTHTIIHPHPHPHTHTGAFDSHGGRGPHRQRQGLWVRGQGGCRAPTKTKGVGMRDRGAVGERGGGAAVANVTTSKHVGKKKRTKEEKKRNGEGRKERRRNCWAMSIFLFFFFVCVGVAHA